MAKNKLNLTLGTKLLLTLFSGTPYKVEVNGVKYELFDFPAVFFASRCNYKQPPSQDKLLGIYGEFLRRAEFMELGEKKFMEVTPNDFTNLLPLFRREAMKMIVRFSEPLYPGEDGGTDDYITIEDVSSAIQLIARNKIWNDELIKKIEPTIRMYMNAVTRKNIVIESDVVVDTRTKETSAMEEINFLNEEIYYTPEYEAVEKSIWKKYVPTKLHKFVDQMDLSEFKKLLVDPLGDVFCPKGWQGEFLVQHKRFNFIAGSRRIGKTFLGAGYLLGRQLMLPMQTVIYIVPTLKNHAKPARRAMSSYFGKCEEFKMNKNDFSIVNTVTGSEAYFITAERNDSVRGAAANLLIVDEAAFIDELIYETASALVRTTNGMVYCISTVNPESPKNRFYYKLIDAELAKYDAETSKYGRRVSLPENPFIPEAEKKEIVEDGRKNPEMFNAEWMCVFMDKDSFNLQKFRVIDQEPVEMVIDGKFYSKWRGEALSKDLRPYYSNFIISHDGAKRKDKPGVAVLGVREGGCDVVMAGYLKGLEYREQVDVVMEMQKLTGLSKTEIIIDYGGAGIAVEEIFRKMKNTFVEPIQAVGGIYEEKDGFVWKVGKQVMVNKMKAATAMGTLRGFSFQDELAMEFETFSEEGRNTSLDNHRDIISAIYQAVRYAERLGYMEKQEEESALTRTRDHMDGEYEPYNNDALDFKIIKGGEDFERYRKFGY